MFADKLVMEGQVTSRGATIDRVSTLLQKKRDINTKYILFEYTHNKLVMEGQVTSRGATID